MQWSMDYRYIQFSLSRGDLQNPEIHKKFPAELQKLLSSVILFFIKRSTIFYLWSRSTLFTHSTHFINFNEQQWVTYYFVCPQYLRATWQEKTGQDSRVRLKQEIEKWEHRKSIYLLQGIDGHSTECRPWLPSFHKHACIPHCIRGRNTWKKEA